MKKLIFLPLLLCFLLVSCVKVSAPNAAGNTAEQTEKEPVVSNDDSGGDTDAPSAIYAPNFDIIFLNGETGTTLSDYKGKPVLLNFWASWCGPCVTEMPHFESVYSKYGEDITILAVNVGENVADVTDFIESNGYSFQIALDADLSIGSLYGVQTIPQTFVIDENGAIISFIEGMVDEQTLTEVVENVIGK